MVYNFRSAWEKLKKKKCEEMVTKELFLLDVFTLKALHAFVVSNLFVISKGYVHEAVTVTL